MQLATWESIFGMHMACNLIIESGISDGREKMKPPENADCGPFQGVTLDTSRGIPVFETGAFSQALPPLRWSNSSLRPIIGFIELPSKLMTCNRPAVTTLSALDYRES